MSNTNLKTFRWKGKNQLGQVLKGTIKALNSNDLIKHLKQQGIISIRMYPVFSFSTFSRKLFENKKKIRTEIIFILQQLSILLSAHVPLIQAFEVIESHDHHLNILIKKMLQDCRLTVQSGRTLAEAFSRHPRYFSDFFCRWIAAGEHSGTLDVLLDHWVLYQDKHQQMRQKIKKALTYPIFILCTAMAVACILFLAVMPVFEKLFHQTGAELPFLTQGVITFALLFKQYGVPFLFFISIAISGLFKFRQNFHRMLFFMHKMQLKLPYAGKILQEITLARFSRTLNILLSAGFPLTEGLLWVSKIINNRFLSDIIFKCQRAVLTGTPLSKIMAQYAYFSPLCRQMVSIGESSGTLEKTLLNTAIFYEKKADYSLEKITELIEPVIMVILGGMAGIFIIAMYQPIFKLGALF